MARLPVYRQQAPPELLTHRELKTRGLRPRTKETPVALLDVRGVRGGQPFESLSGLYRAEQCQPHEVAGDE